MASEASREVGLARFGRRYFSYLTPLFAFFPHGGAWSQPGQNRASLGTQTYFPSSPLSLGGEKRQPEIRLRSLAKIEPKNRSTKDFTPSFTLPVFNF